MVKHSQTTRCLPWLLSCIAFAVVLMAGCMKEGEDIILLPVQNYRIPTSVLSPAEQDSLSQYMEINDKAYNSSFGWNSYKYSCYKHSQNEIIYFDGKVRKHWNSG